MTKIMLVEDDKSLREIYGVRLLAEGYDIVSAGDGEQALAMAIKERPQLIVSDVMMPKISGFDLLDILRSTTETKNTKVIMMTALSSEDQRLRGEQLGADRYLVKSQVGIEDVVRVVHEVLGDGAQPAAAPQQQQQQPQPQAQAAAPQPTQPQQPVAPQEAPQQATPPQEPATPQQAAPTPEQAQPAAPATPPQPALSRARVIQPLNDPSASTININELLDKELAKEAGVDMNERPTIATTEQEKTQVNQEIENFTPPTLQQDEQQIDQILHQPSEKDAVLPPSTPQAENSTPSPEQEQPQQSTPQPAPSNNDQPLSFEQTPQPNQPAQSQPSEQSAPASELPQPQSFMPTPNPVTPNLQPQQPQQSSEQLNQPTNQDQQASQ